MAQDLRIPIFFAVLFLAVVTLVRADDLTAKLENARFHEETSSATLDFVLANQTKEPIRIAERWNSWGAYQWGIVMTNSDGSRVVFSNPQHGWFMNFLTVATIEPGRELRTACVLLLHDDSPQAKGVAVFVAADRKAHFSPPLRLQGNFVVEKPLKDGAIETNWKGNITSPAIELAK